MKNKNVLARYSSIECVDLPMETSPKGQRIYIPSVDIADLAPWSLNVRFAPSVPMTDEIHHKKIKNQAPREYLNLRRSIALMKGIIEPLMAIYDPHINKFVIHAGNRRFFCGKEEGLSTFPVYVYLNFSELDLSALRDHAEVNPTKVSHNMLYVAKLVRDAMSASSVERRGEVYKEAKARWGMKKNEVDQKVRVADEIIAFRGQRSQLFDHDPSCFKAFEAKDNLNQSVFARLREVGDFEKLVKLSEIADEYLEKNIAHDDMSKGVTFLAEASATEPVWEDIGAGRLDVKSVEGLREITAIARARDAATHDVAAEVRKAIARAFYQLQESQSVSSCDAVLAEFEIGRAKVNAVRSVALLVTPSTESGEIL